jgi:hypothetical protein
VQLHALFASLVSDGAELIQLDFSADAPALTLERFCAWLGASALQLRFSG